MPAMLVGAQGSVTFRNVAMFLSQAEWLHLDSTQSSSYQEVTLENYNNLLSLRILFSQPKVISQLQQADHWLVKKEVPRGTCLGWESLFLPSKKNKSYMREL
uniref:KRAB domain-containing protein n=1 Tax=Oryctolagus cuniculus TaxID=9986 RepID=A0A5F9D6V8_RABIT